MGEVLAVLSGKGGTGKTSVCAGIAQALAEDGLKILCVDCDVGLRNLDISLGMMEGCSLSFLDMMEGSYPLTAIPSHPVYPSLFFLTAPMNRTADQIDEESFCRMLRDARRYYDYIFLDAPAGVDAGFRLVSRAADRFLIVTGSGPAAVRDAGRVGELLELMGRHNARLIVNRVDKHMLSTVRVTIDDVMDNAGLPLCGIVPEDPCITLAASFGQPVSQYARRCPAMNAFRRIAKRIQGFPQRITWK